MTDPANDLIESILRMVMAEMPQLPLATIKSIDDKLPLTTQIGRSSFSKAAVRVCVLNIKARSFVGQSLLREWRSRA